MKPVAWLRQLSLFGGGSEPVPAPGRSIGQPPASALAPVPTQGSSDPQSAPSHPRANRRVVLHGLELAYELRTAQRRSIGLLVGADGLTVRAPRWVRQSDIDSLLLAKSAWILAKLKAQQSRTQQALQSRIVWANGAELPYLGGRLCIRLRPEQAGLQLEAVSAADLEDASRAHTLWVGMPQSTSAAQLRDIVQSWLQAQALALFKERCEHFSERLGVRVTRLSLSSATRRWGSATAQGAVRLNWRLVHFGLPVIDYVVAHELAHLKEMNHSEAFWAVVRSVMPDYETARQPLKDEVLPDLG